jgi:uncharacterized Zn-finger protein
LMILGATDPTGQVGWLFIGVILIGIGLVLVFFAFRKPAQAADGSDVTLKIDLPSNVAMDTLKCKSCGGTLGPNDIKMVAGAPVVTCPYCHTTYQLTEEPKW